MATTELSASVRVLVLHPDILDILRDAKLALEFAGADARHLNMASDRAALYYRQAESLQQVIKTMKLVLEPGQESQANARS
jgi:hypothetical protein